MREQKYALADTATEDEKLMNEKPTGNKATPEDEKQAAKPSLAERFFMPDALEQLSTYRIEALVAFIALLSLSLATLLSTHKVAQLLERSATLTAPANHPVIPVIIASLIVLASIAALIWALLKIASPLKKRIVVGRLIVLALVTLLVTSAKSLILGYFARFLFQGDPIRFELAKTGVDHLSSLLGIALAAAIYVLLARCLKEEKITLVRFGKSYALLLVWIAAIYLVKFISLSLLPNHLLISSVAATLSTVAALWYISLALALQKESAATQDQELDTDPELESEQELDPESELDQDSELELQKDAS